jgi:Predicted rRNA methylase (SpoU class)
LIPPFGFVISEKILERAALDYGEGVEIILHKNFEAFLQNTQLRSYYSVSTKGGPMMNDISIKAGDFLMFGSETKGLPKGCLTPEKCQKVIRIPMANGSRSLTLSNSVAIIVYFALGPNDFTGLS